MTGWITDVVGALGEWGVGLLIVLETVLPPIPSEVVLPFAGFSASRGAISLPLTWVTATLGATAGAWLLYAIAAWVGEHRLRALVAHRWFVLATPSDLDRSLHFFHRYGAAVVLAGRCVPGLRSAVSLPAGLLRMRPLRFTALTAVGSGVWNALLLGGGYALGERWHTVSDYVQPVGTAVAVLAGVALVVWVVVVIRRRARPGAGTHDGMAGDGTSPGAEEEIHADDEGLQARPR